MASLKEIKGRIGSVDSTKQITSAMKMVASAKLHKAQEAIENMFPYERCLNAIGGNLLSMDSSFVSPFTINREVGKVAIVVFSSNSSLGGAFNANVIKRLVTVLEEYAELGKDNLFIYPIGKKVSEAVKKMGYASRIEGDKIADKPNYLDAAAIAEVLMHKFTTGEIDKVELIYHHFKSTASQILLREQFLPVVPENSFRENNSYKDYILEPDYAGLMEKLVPKMLSIKMYTVLLDSNASEHAARTMAMQIATDNAEELLKELRQQNNKSRQQAVTNELLDIVGGSMN